MNYLTTVESVVAGLNDGPIAVAGLPNQCRHLPCTTVDSQSPPLYCWLRIVCISRMPTYLPASSRHANFFLDPFLNLFFCKKSIARNYDILQ
jgi:hypothetical protein